MTPDSRSQTTRRTSPRNPSRNSIGHDDTPPTQSHNQTDQLSPTRATDPTAHTHPTAPQPKPTRPDTKRSTSGSTIMSLGRSGRARYSPSSDVSRLSAT